MTDKINLDDVDATSDDAAEPANDGDWFWRGEDGPPAADAPSESRAGKADPAETNVDETSAEGATDRSASIPHVPYEDKNRPAGVPRERGGSGGGARADAEAWGGGKADGSRTASDERRESGGSESGGDAPPEVEDPAAEADDMTMAFTFDAVRRLADVRFALADANEWCDWIGIVGDVDAHVINKFQRERGVDVDFFNGAGTGPAERLAEIDERSMFYAERMVVVGTEGEEALAERAGWEFVPLAHAAAEAGWDVD